MDENVPVLSYEAQLAKFLVFKIFFSILRVKINVRLCIELCSSTELCGVRLFASRLVNPADAKICQYTAMYIVFRLVFTPFH